MRDLSSAPCSFLICCSCQWCCVGDGYNVSHMLVNQVRGYRALAFKANQLGDTHTVQALVQALTPFFLRCQVLVASMEEWIGSAVLDNVHIDKCGQKDTTRYALNFLSPSWLNASSISNSAISQSSASGIHLNNATGVTISGNVIYDSRGGSVDIVDSSDILLEVSGHWAQQAQGRGERGRGGGH